MPPRIASTLLAVAIGGAPCAAAAQRVPPPALTTSGPAVGPYERARRLVEQGQGALGRAVADSLVAASPPGSPALAEALWWRATLSADGARAEQDLRRIVDAFSSSPRVGDATVRIAQLDISRDRPDMAEPTLARLVRERPDDPARAQAAYWLARARLELGDTRGGCTALADAATWARSSETFTRQQVAELRGRLPACDPASVVSVMPPPRGSALTPAPQPAPQTVAAALPTPAPPPASSPAPTPRVAAPAAPPAVSAQRIDSLEAAELRHRNAVLTDARRVPPPTSPPSSAPASLATRAPSTPATVAAAPPPPTPRAAAPATTSPATAPTVTAPRAATPAAPAAAPVATASAPPSSTDAGGNFAVQVAAYNQRDGAESLATRLRTRGIDARATGSVAPFRVKIGRYPTRAAAAAARATFAGQGIAGFVTDAGDGPAGGGRP